MNDTGVKFIDYTKQLKYQFAAGNTTEHSFRAHLYNLFKSLYPQTCFTMTNEPQRIKCGAPDYIIQCNGVPVGYIETKDIIKNLDKLDDREQDQFKRYTESLDNVIYTNYLDFRLYRNQELVKETSIAEIKNGKVQLIRENIEEVSALIQDFAEFNGQPITSPETLAKQMARKAREFANAIITVLTSKDDTSFQASTLQAQYKTFKKVLIENLDPVSFAGMYAQTVAYGLFAARLNDPTPNDFSRDEAVRLIPKNNQCLRSLFESITGSNLEPAVEWIVDDLTDMFRRTDLKQLLKTYGQTTETNDPFIHFYETFLREYDPQIKQELGVYYTPKPVVNFIVKSIDYALKNDLNVTDGLANTDKVTVQIESSIDRTNKSGRYSRKISDRTGKAGFDYHKIQILDPAVGTGTFPAEVIRYISKQFKSQAGLWEQYVKNDLLPRINAFELMMVPYAICHLKLDMLLQETGYDMASDDARMNVYLTDTLEKPHNETQNLWSAFLTQEATYANVVKNDKPIMIVLGNPPYNDVSDNKGKWIMKIMEDYKKEPVSGIPLQERNPKHINDDYIKFIRYAQYLIDKNQEGVIAYINPHGYLDAVTMRGVRYSLLTSFDSIYVLNLHGNTNRGETCPDGSVDQNVFDIMQGVCINIFVKKRNHNKNNIATVYYADLYGKRTEKYEFLYANDISTIHWTKFIPQHKNYFMIPPVPEHNNTIDQYTKGIQLTDLFNVNSMGFITARDKFAVGFTKEEMSQRFYDAASPDITDDELKTKYHLKETKNWTINDLRSTVCVKDINEILTKCSYRPFDFRWCCLSFGFMDRPRREIIDNVLHKENLCIIAPRQQSIEGFNHVWISDLPAEACIVSTASREVSQVYPLYVYGSKGDLFGKEESKHINFKKTTLKQFCKSAKISMIEDISKKKKDTQFTPEELVYYIYAILSADKYSKDFSAFLKSDHPYIPIPETAESFFTLSNLGKELAQTTMMHTVTPRTELKTTYPIPGPSYINKIKYDNGNIYINDTQYFGHVSLKTWNFTAGRHQPAQLWLKYRKGRILTANDIIYYQQMLAAIEKTIKLKDKINEMYCRYF